MKKKEYTTREELIAFLDEYGAKQSWPFTGKEILSGKASLYRLGNHDILPWVEKYRIKPPKHEPAWSENHFDISKTYR